MSPRPKRAIHLGSSAVAKDVARLGIPIDSLPDDVLLAGLGTGDPDIAVAFVRRFQRTMFGVAVAVLGDQRLAEDVAQQAFERAWRHAQMYDSRRGSVRTWLTTIAHNLAIDAVRARKPIPMDPTELGGMLDAIRDTPERRAVANEDSMELRAELLTLPREQARAVVLAGIYGLTAKQIAEMESIPLGTAKTRIRTAMEKLRGKLSVKRVDHE